jgi:hypothetical protein
MEVKYESEGNDLPKTTSENGADSAHYQLKKIVLGSDKRL